MNLRMVIPIQIALLALLAGSYFLVVSIRDSSDESGAPRPVTSTIPTTERLESRAGGFAIAVPEGVSATKDGKTVTLRSPDKDLVVVAGPIERDSLAASSKAFVRSLRQSYTNVRVLGSQKQRVDDRDALATVGEAVNAREVRIRFVALVVEAEPQNIAISSFSEFDAPPAAVLPTVSAIVDGFSVQEQ